jgi:hypothetical protein
VTGVTFRAFHQPDLGPCRQNDQNVKRDAIRNGHGMAVPIDSHAYQQGNL